MLWARDGKDSLAELCRNEQIATSPFWNIFARIDLGLFLPAEAEAFIRNRFNAADVTVADNELARVLQLAGRFPFFLQLACYHLFETKVGRSSGWEADFERDAYDHLRYLWEHRTRQERQALRWVLGIGGRIPDERLLWDLERRGLLVQDRQKLFGLWVFSEAFEGIVRNPPKASRKMSFSLRNVKKFKITFWPPGFEIERDER